MKVKLEGQNGAAAAPEQIDPENKLLWRMAIANQRAGNDRRVVAIIGDGAMTAGMAYEALNHAGGMDPEPDLLVILNDNRMSISENVGGLTKMLGRATGSRTLNAIREGGKKLLGDKNNPTAKFVRRWEEHWKGMKSRTALPSARNSGFET